MSHSGKDSELYLSLSLIINYAAAKSMKVCPRMANKKHLLFLKVYKENRAVLCGYFGQHCSQIDTHLVNFIVKNDCFNWRRSGHLGIILVKDTMIIFTSFSNSLIKVYFQSLKRKKKEKIESNKIVTYQTKYVGEYSGNYFSGITMTSEYIIKSRLSMCSLGLLSHMLLQLSSLRVCY
jgi:hypothetical protein